MMISDNDWILTTVGSILSQTDSDPLTGAATGPHPRAIFGKTQEAKAISLLDVAGRTDSTRVIGGNTELTGVSHESWAFDTYITGDLHVGS